MTNSKIFKNILSMSVVTIFSVIVAIIFGKYSVSLLYLLIFAITLSRPWMIKISDMFISSIILDIYTQGIVGLLFVQCLALYVITMRFRSILLNCRISFGVFCFFLILLIPESISFFSMYFFGSGSNFFPHLKRILIASFFFSLYCAFSIFRKKRMEKYV